MYTVSHIRNMYHSGLFAMDADQLRNSRSNDDVTSALSLKHKVFSLLSKGVSGRSLTLTQLNPNHFRSFTKMIRFMYSYSLLN